MILVAREPVRSDPYDFIILPNPSVSNACARHLAARLPLAPPLATDDSGAAGCPGSRHGPNQAPNRVFRERGGAATGRGEQPGTSCRFRVFSDLTRSSRYGITPPLDHLPWPGAVPSENGAVVCSRAVPRPVRCLRDAGDCRRCGGGSHHILSYASTIAVDRVDLDAAIGQLVYLRRAGR